MIEQHAPAVERDLDSPLKSLSIYPEEETAFEWLQRVQSNKRKLSQNPIFFPLLSKASSEYSDPSRFIVSDRNFICMAAQTFQCHVGKLNELKSRSQRWTRRRTKERNENLSELEDLLLQSFPRGTGIPFVDKMLVSKSNSKNGIALEVFGRTGTAKTKLLMALAANYVAATSTSCLGLPKSSVSLPVAIHQIDPVVIFDPEHAIDVDELFGLVRVAILRRWNSTNQFRQCLERARQHRNDDGGNEIDMPYQFSNGCDDNDYRNIEQDIQSALGRIHILRPRDVANGYVSALESLCQALDRQFEDDETMGTNAESPPVMLLLDSVISAFQLSNKMQESLPNGSGLSGLNDFVRQLNRLRSKHSIFLVSTRTITGNSPNQFRSSSDGWDKIISHRLSIMKSIAGSPEERDGHEFVALCKAQNDATSEHVVGPAQNHHVIPFSFTSNGISCQSNA